MRTLAVYAAAFAALGMTAGIAVAQTNMSSAEGPTAMSTGSMNSGDSMNGMHVSRMDMRTLRQCGAMTHDAMMATPKCQRMMSKHPEMFNADGTVKMTTTHE
jgi:hypothetical protein